MKKSDFRYIRFGKPLQDLSAEDIPLLMAVHQSTKRKQKALLILHGFGSSPAVFRHLLPKIGGYDALICPVLVGHAESIEVFSKIKAADWITQTKEICEALIEEYKIVDVLGLSLGGLLAYELSKTFPIHHLYLLAPALRLRAPFWGLPFLKFCKQLGFRHLRNKAGNIANPLHGELTFRKLPITTLIEILTLNKHFQWQPPNCPVDLFLGAEDRVVDTEAVAHLFEEQPQTTIHWLKDSAHVLPLDNDLEAIVACINEQNSP